MCISLWLALSLSIYICTRKFMCLICGEIRHELVASACRKAHLPSDRTCVHRHLYTFRMYLYIYVYIHMRNHVHVYICICICSVFCLFSLFVQSSFCSSFRVDSCISLQMPLVCAHVCPAQQHAPPSCHTPTCPGPLQPGEAPRLRRLDGQRRGRCGPGTARPG